MITYVLVVLFGIGAWIAINGLWVELPVMVQEIPESWSLPSYLTVIIQLGNVGPLAFTILNLFHPRKINEVSVTYVLIIIGISSCSLLALFWKETAYIAGAERSVALLILSFFLATVDCTSSVAFVPYMARFRFVYLSPYFVGEGLSGLLPSLVALAQGVGEGASHEKCAAPLTINSSNATNSTSQSWGPGPRFSTDVFFWFLTGMMVLCGLAFLGLNTLPVIKKQKVQTPSMTSSASDMYELQNIDNVEGRPKQYIDNPVIEQSTRTNVFLLIVLAVINGLSNGIIPAIQSYACIPYSYYIYLLTLTLSNIANPLTCLIFPLMRTKSVPLLTVLSIIYCCMCTYILVIASQSPNVLLKCHDAGAVLIVSISFFNVYFLCEIQTQL